MRQNQKDLGRKGTTLVYISKSEDCVLAGGVGDGERNQRERK